MIKSIRSILRSQKGFTLIEAMIVVAIMGIIGMVVSRMLRGGMQGWYFNVGHMSSQRQIRVARDTFTKFVRQASAATVIIDRLNASQPVLSMITFVDSAGNSRAFFQKNNQFYAGLWSGTRTNVSSTNLLLPNYLQRASFYYPDSKNFSKLGFCFYSVWPIPASLGTSIPTALNGTVDIRDP